MGALYEGCRCVINGQGRVACCACTGGGGGGQMIESHRRGAYMCVIWGGAGVRKGHGRGLKVAGPEETLF